MKLYHYDHCPYCVKARLIFGLKDVAVEEEILLNDDEDTPISMIGQKMLPILKKDDGSFMPESMDIVHFIDGLNGNPKVKPSKNHEELNLWLKDCRQYHYALAMPRWVAMGLEEFATPEAVVYFTRKKEMSIGPFDQAVAKTNELVAMGNEHLKKLEEIIVGQPFFWGKELTEDDFHVFASLRVLTTTSGITFPWKIEAYMNSLSEAGKVPLHWDKALGESF